VSSPGDPALRLAQRLRQLREQSWRGKRVTQKQLAQALKVSMPLISSWEKSTEPVVPPQARLEAYATFFATSRSVDKRPFRLVSQLTEEEQAVRDALLAELTELRDEALGGSEQPLADNLWRFTPDQDITIVCSELPARLLQQFPGSNPEDPDYAELYRYADLDSLFELHGHIRAMNPISNVYVRPGSGILKPDEYTSHLVLLGGVDWNQVTAQVLHRIDLPIQQQERPEIEDTAVFEVVENEVVLQTFEPVLRRVDGRQVLEEDVAHFYRSPNPFNQKRTVTMCNGVYSRGVLGAVRALTDVRFRDRNNAHVQSRFAGQQTFSILSRVQVLQGSVVTPDWTKPDQLLYEWAK
jgi:transcriptional regulator with XRE-family HTH domain